MLGHWQSFYGILGWQLVVLLSANLPSAKMNVQSICTVSSLQLEDEKMIEQMNCPFKVVVHGFDGGGGHVCGDGLDLGMRATQPSPEGFQGLDAFAVADDNAGEKIEHDGQLAIPLADVDFVDSDLLERVQRWLAEVALDARPELL